MKNLHHLDIWVPSLLATPRAQGTGDSSVKGGKGIGAHDYDDDDCEYDGDDEDDVGVYDGGVSVCQTVLNVSHSDGPRCSIGGICSIP